MGRKKCLRGRKKRAPKRGSKHSIEFYKEVEDKVMEEEEEEEEVEEGVKSANLLSQYITEISTSFYDTYGPAAQMIDSYNHFMDEIISEIFIKIGYVDYEIVTNRRLNQRRLHRARILTAAIDGSGGRFVTRQATSGETIVIYPYEARIRGLSYSRKLYATWQHEILDVDSAGGTTQIEKSIDTVQIGEIPIMVKSKYCSCNGMGREDLADVKEDPDDPGGYFIIKGKEKVIISQERIALNKVFIFKPMSGQPYLLEAEIRSVAHPICDTVFALWIRFPGKKVDTACGGSGGSFFFKQPVTVGPKLKWSGKNRAKNLTKMYDKVQPGLVVYHASLKTSFPLLILYAALGVLDTKTLWGTIGVSEELQELFAEVLRTTMESRIAAKIKSQRDAFLYIGKLVKLSYSDIFQDRQQGIKRAHGDDDYVDCGRDFINVEILPHVGTSMKDYSMKACHIGYIVCKLVKAYLGLIPCDDRDKLENKRYDFAGTLLGNLLKKLMGSEMEYMKRRLIRKVENKIEYDFFKEIAGSSSLTKGLEYSLASGNWGCKGGQGQPASVRVGVSQPLNRLNTIATLSFLRRINAPLSRLSRMTAPRNVHNTAFGYICPVDTPEGEPVGYVKNLAIMAHVSVDAPSGAVISALYEEQDVHRITEENLHLLQSETKIIVNGKIVGTYPSQEILHLIEHLKTLRAAWDEQAYEKYRLLKYKEKRMWRQREKHQGLAIGTYTNNIKFFNEKDFKRNLGFQTMISNQTSISYDHELRELNIRCDGGRPIRPLYPVKNNVVALRQENIDRLLNKEDVYGWKDLIKENIVEFVDPAEEENTYIAFFPRDLLDPNPHEFGAANREFIRSTRYTHCEIDPGGILGVSAVLIPYANHNQVPRITFQTNMSRQAVGVYAMNYNYRFDTDSHIPYSVQRPLVTSKSGSAFSKFDENPSGLNAIVAIMTFTGYNQEDSVIMNASSIDRGFFRSINYKTKVDEAVVNKAFLEQGETFEIPIAEETGRCRDFHVLEFDGLPAIGSVINDGDVVIGKTQKTSPSAQASGRLITKKQDISQVYRAPFYASSYNASPGSKDPIPPGRTVVDSVVVCDNDDGYRACKVKLRQVRCPQIGDKFTSRHGQKGVMSIAYHECDMPFSSQGMTPDIIINPHAIPSRMTIGNLLEMVDAKLAALTGKIANRPTFSTCKNFSGQNGHDIVVQDIGTALKKLGFNPNGEELMFCGRTGRKIRNQTFIGPCFYQRLKHMIEDKMRFRAKGPVTALCRQPTCGMSRGGGLRFGEMERDSAISHGGMYFLRERLFLVSDYFKTPVCQICGQIMITKTAPFPTENPIYFKCNFCKAGSRSAVMFEMPYATKLFFQELMSMNIRVGIFSDELPTEKIFKAAPTSSSSAELKKSGGDISVMDEILSTMMTLKELTEGPGTQMDKPAKRFPK